MSKPHFEAASPPEFKEDGTAVTFGPRQLSIIWGNDKRYWQMPETNDKPAELLQVCWLEVTGKTGDLKDGHYEISFEVEMKQGSFGWSKCPLFMMAKVGKAGRYAWKKVDMAECQSDGDNKKRCSIPKDNFTVEVKGSESEKKIYFGLYEVWSGRWKGGLLIHNATVKKVT